jgi:hypothetical protein
MRFAHHPIGCSRPVSQQHYLKTNPNKIIRMDWGEACAPPQAPTKSCAAQLVPTVKILDSRTDAARDASCGHRLPSASPLGFRLHVGAMATTTCLLVLLPLLAVAASHPGHEVRCDWAPLQVSWSWLVTLTDRIRFLRVPSSARP